MEEEEGSGVVSVGLLCVKGSIPQCVIKYVFIMLSKSMAYTVLLRWAYMSLSNLGFIG